MTEEQIKHMVSRFLGWRLPENFSPDAGISFKKTFNEHTPLGPQKHEPVGTNLFDADQADAMVRYMVEGIPMPTAAAADEEAWLIEAAWSTIGRTSYLCVRNDNITGTHFAWTPEWNSTTEHMNALRFARKQDAEAFVRALWRLAPDLLRGQEAIPQPKIVSHSWSNP